MSSSGDRVRALLIILSGPSGAGKTTLCRRLLRERSDLTYSVSCTTRPARGREEDGRDYHYLSEAEFERRVAGGLFLEHATVHGFRYGTLRAPVESALRAGRGVVMDIDVQGAGQIRQTLTQQPGPWLSRDHLVDIFVEAPSPDDLRARLSRRGEDSPDSVESRLRNAEREMRRAGEFKYRIVNANLDAAYAELARILDEEGRKHG